MMIVIDANALVLLVVGLMDKKLIAQHKRTSIYQVQDFEDLFNFIQDLSNVVVLPNVWTEVDNLLNKFTGLFKYEYV